MWNYKNQLNIGKFLYLPLLSVYMCIIKHIYNETTDIENNLHTENSNNQLTIYGDFKRVMY